MLKKCICNGLILCLFVSLVACWSTGEKNDESVEKNKEIMRQIQDKLYPSMKESIYDKIDGSMNYIDVQNMMDRIEYQMQAEVPQFHIDVDFTNGTYYPTWIFTIQPDDGAIYYLMYISVEFDYHYYAKRKHIGRYDI